MIPVLGQLVLGAALVGPIITPSPYPVTFQPAYKGFSLGESPIGQYGFEYLGAQYAFLFQAGFGTLGAPCDYKCHALRSADTGLTWTELDAAHAPFAGEVGFGIVLDQATVVRDGATAVLLWVRASSSSAFHGITTDTFDLSAGLWGTPADYAAPVLDVTLPRIPVSNRAFVVQLIRRGTQDYILYYSGPGETVVTLNRARSYCATFNGTAFGAATKLPGQTGVDQDFRPLSAVADSAGITHFLRENQGAGLLGSTVSHTGMDAAGTFGATQILTDAQYWGVTQGIVSQLITVPAAPGHPERLACCLSVDLGGPGFLANLNMYTAPAGALNPVWSDSLITGDNAFALCPAGNDPLPASIALGYSNRTLACVWSVSADGSGDPDTFDWYISQTDSGTLAWSAPAILETRPYFSEAARSNQVYAYTMGAGIGILTVWASNSGDLIARFSLLAVPAIPGGFIFGTPSTAIFPAAIGAA